jgi:nucleoside triphosphate diphosphatase
LKKSLLEQANKTLPELNYAVELQRLAAEVGFDWPDVQGVISKIHEEIDEVTAEISTPDNHGRLLDEIGDLLFACTNLARHLNVDPELALKAGNQKFLRRFSMLEHHLIQNNQDISQCSLKELDNIWGQVKSHEKNN